MKTCSRPLFLLLASASLGLPLSACQSTMSWMDNITGGMRPSQSVGGPRRLPALNPNISAPNETPPTPRTVLSPYPTENTAAGAASPPPQNQGSLFDELFTGGDSAEVRKPLPANAYSGVPAVAEPEPQAVMIPPPPSEPVMVQQTPAPAVSGSTAQTSWFSRMVQSIREPFEGPEAAPSPSGSAEFEHPYPNLASVPPPPGQFTSVKAEKERAMQDLRDEHALAQEEKQELMSEPSTQQQMIPEPMPTQAEVTAPAGEPELLGHASDGYQPPVASAPVMPPPMAEPQQATAEKGPNKWWEGWNTFNEKPASEPVSAASAPEPVYVPPPMEPKPLLAEEPARTLPPVNVAAEDARPEQDDTAALPSPQILRDVKMLPPSRYLGRIQALQHPGATQ